MLPICLMTESASAALATSAAINAGFVPGSTINIYQGISNLDKQAPAVICYAGSAKEDFPDTGIYHVSLKLMVKQMAADTSLANVGSVSVPIFSAFLTQGIEQVLASQISNYYVFKLIVEDYEDTTDLDAWCQAYTFDVICELTN